LPPSEGRALGNVADVLAVCSAEDLGEADAHVEDGAAVDADATMAETTADPERIADSPYRLGSALPSGDASFERQLISGRSGHAARPSRSMVSS
jgi:hypothetical protein